MTWPALVPYRGTPSIPIGLPCAVQSVHVLSVSMFAQFANK
jgi:hypothetical protein